MVNKVRNVSNLEEMKELNDGLQRKHVMIIHVIKMMNDDQVENFIDKLTSFIIKWIHILEEAKSAPTTKIINFFFSTDFISFHIVFFYWCKSLHLFISFRQRVYISTISTIKQYFQKFNKLYSLGKSSHK